MEFKTNNELELIKKYKKNIVKFQSTLRDEFLKSYESEYASIQAPFDMLKFEKTYSLTKSYSDVSLIVLIGIGGSNLGTLAILEAIYGKNYNSKLKVPILNAETTDSYEISEILTRIKQEIARGKKVLVNCVSKSGGTTETIALLDIIEDVVKLQRNYKNYIVCTTQKESKLDTYAQRRGYKSIHIEETVGGRYSVFSPVGIFPLEICGVNTKQLLLGAQKEIKNQIILNHEDSISNLSALNIYHNFSKHNCIELNQFFFVKQFEGLGKWYRQLIGESLGKEFNLENKKVHFGITPLISLGSTDLHSMAQLFIGGPNRVYHQLISVKNNSNFDLLKVSSNQELIQDIKEKSLQDIMNAIINGLKQSFINRNIKFDEYILQNNSPYEIGRFMQSRMIEMMFLGQLCNVNPFNQPNVEEYKIETKKELSK